MPIALHNADTLEYWAGEHLLYELQQLVGCVVVQVRHDLVHASLSTATFVSNAVFESHLSHLRGLDDFFLFDHEPDKNGKPTHADDVLAVDYLPTFAAGGVLDTTERKQINTRLHHVSVNRTSIRQPWNTVETARRFLRKFETFVSAAEAPAAELRVESPAVLRRVLDEANAVLTMHGIAFTDG